MRRLLLTVENTFLYRSRNALVLMPQLVDLNTSRPLKQPIGDWWPDFPRAPSPRPTQVELRLPNGTTRMVACRFGDVHITYRRQAKQPLANDQGMHGPARRQMHAEQTV
jgi:hypothetical protein